MIKKYFLNIISIFILVIFTMTTIAPAEVFAATATPTKASTVKKATTKKKTTKKKKVTKKKEKLIAVPPLITLDTAPHSPKPIAKATKKKTTSKKKVVKKA